MFNLIQNKLCVFFLNSFLQRKFNWEHFDIHFLRLYNNAIKNNWNKTWFVDCHIVYWSTTLLIVTFTDFWKIIWVYTLHLQFQSIFHTLFDFNKFVSLTVRKRHFKLNYWFKSLEEFHGFSFTFRQLLTFNIVQFISS